MKGVFLGPAFAPPKIEAILKSIGASYKAMTAHELIRSCVTSLAAGEALEWFQGRMEFGPRALRAPSILGDARSLHMRATLNLKVRYRESFRPFAPSVLREHVSEWFDLDDNSPYMLLVANVSTHSNCSSRNQSPVPRLDFRLPPGLFQGFRSRLT
jgi:carbamoyltransferase